MSAPVDVPAVVAAYFPATCTPTEAGRKALARAAVREGGFVCPVQGVTNGPAETMLLRKLRQQGFITDEACPRITDAGRAALARIAKAVQP